MSRISLDVSLPAGPGASTGIKRRAAARFGSFAMAIVFAADCLLLAAAVSAPATPRPAIGGGSGEARADAYTVRLVTGDVVKVSGSGVAVIPAVRSGIGAQVEVQRMGPSTYVIPDAAVPYLGRYLDRELFNVTAAFATPAGTGQRVRLVSAPGRVAALDGFTVTSRTTGGALGYFTSAGARAFGAALDRQWTLDQQTRPAAAVPSLFAGLSRLAPAPTSDAVAPVVPAFAQVSLAMRVLDRHGTPVAFAVVALFNTDDGRRYTGFVYAVDGLARASLPLGHYSAEVHTDELEGPAGDRVVSRFVVVSDYDVTGAGQVLVLDARRATIRPSVRTPVPATMKSLQLEWARYDRRGVLLASVNEIYQDPTADVRVAPAPPARVGRMQWLTTWSLATSARVGLGSTYDLAYLDRSVIADQGRIVVPAQLTTVHAHYFVDGRPRTSSFGRAPFVAGGYTVLFNPLPTPGARTEYVLSPPGTIWTSVFIGAEATFDTALSDGWRKYRAGAAATVDWLHPALLPGFAEPTAADRFAPDPVAFECPACRVDDQLLLRLSALTDSTPGHTGSLDVAPSGRTNARLQLFQDGHLIDDESNTTFATVAASARAADYRLLFRVDAGMTRGGDSSTTMDLHFRSAPRQGPLLPSGWTCAGVPADDECRALPVLSVRAPLPVDLDGQLTSAGSHAVPVTVSHVPGAAAIPIMALTMETRVGGTAWRPAPSQRQSDGDYLVDLPAGPTTTADTPVDLRIFARDAAGNTLLQTVTHAYTEPRSQK